MQTQTQIAVRVRHIPGFPNVIAAKMSRHRQVIQTAGQTVVTATEGVLPSDGIHLRWTCLPPDSTANCPSLYSLSQIRKPGKWMLGKPGHVSRATAIQK